MNSKVYIVLYLLRVAGLSIYRNLLLNLVSAATISMSLLILSSFWLLNVNMQKILETSSQGLTVSVYLKDELDPDAIENLKNEIQDIGGVINATYVSKDQALSDLKQRLGDQGVILNGLEDNPLPASLELDIDSQFRHEGRIEALTEELRAKNGVDQVHYAWEWADKLQIFINFIRMSGYIIGGLLFAAILFIIANTIKLAVMARKDELYIMGLMGATKNYIRTPFFLEGAVQGVIGGLMALALLYLIYNLFVSRIQLPLGFAAVKLSFLPGHLSWTLLATGAGLGLLGSYLSLTRFIEK